MPVSSAEKLLELGNRRRIYERVREVPGIHLRALQRDLNMPLGTLEYHLYQMEKESLLAVRDDGRFKSFFTQETLDRRDRDVLYYLRQEMPRRIALEIADAPGISFKELTARMPISASTLSFHLKKLVGAGVVQEQPVGREKTYFCPDSDRIKRLVVRYRASFVDEMVDRFADAWLNLGLE